MSGTPTIVATIKTRLLANDALMAIAVGGVYSRPISRQGPGATPLAFVATQPYLPRCSIVVTDGGDAADLNAGRQAFFSYPTLFFYASATELGRADLANAYAAARDLLVGWRFALPNGTGAAIERIAGRVGVRDAPDVEGAVIDTMRLQVVGLYKQDS